MKKIKIVNTLLLSLLICSGGHVIGEPDVFNDNLKSKVDSPDKRSLYQRFQESELATKAKNLLMRKVENEHMVERKRINATGREDDLTALHIASREGNLKEAKRFLDSGANVYAKDALGKTALHYAAQNGHSEIVNELLKKGAAVNAKDNDENTPLHLAYYAKQNYDFNEQARKGGNKVVKAPYKHYYKKTVPGQKYDYGIIENLINSGADENIRNNMHEVPGH
ncbi:MAG: ankyrin repeat domain-containing protein, partial [Candidatus Dependentiae bacterium]|nr:ankyrin repeat domain-containing protein [Candidatus Dependentiae bacterium]